MKKEQITLKFETDHPFQVDRVIFEALQNAVRNESSDHDLEIISSLLIAATKFDQDRWNEYRRKTSDSYDTSTIDAAVRSAILGDVSDDDAKLMGSIRAQKIKDAIGKVKA